MKKRIFAVLICLIVFTAAFPLCASAATAVPAVTFNSTNITVTFDETDMMESGLFATFSAEEGYMMPEDITVTIDGQPFEEYRYGSGVNYRTGDLLILPQYITGDVVITISGIANYNVKFKGENYSISVPVPDGKSLNEQYNNPDKTVEKEGHEFMGWFESSDGGVTLFEESFDFDAPRTEDVTLYPKWSENSQEFPGPDIENPSTNDVHTGFLCMLFVLFAVASVSMVVAMYRKRIK